MELASQVLLGHFGPVYLLQVSKNDEEKCWSLKWFGFIHISQKASAQSRPHKYIIVNNASSHILDILFCKIAS